MARQAGILEALAKVDGYITTKEVAAFLHESTAAIHIQNDRLAEKGFIEYGKLGKYQAIKITDAGREWLTSTSGRCASQTSPLTAQAILEAERLRGAYDPVALRVLVKHIRFPHCPTCGHQLTRRETYGD